MTCWTRARSCGKRDIGIKYGQIAAITPSISADRPLQRIDASGKLVTPGLIDLHTHFCPHLGIGLEADELVPITCTTTAVSDHGTRDDEIGKGPVERKGYVPRVHGFTQGRARFADGSKKSDRRQT